MFFVKFEHYERKYFTELQIMFEELCSYIVIISIEKDDLSTMNIGFLKGEMADFGFSLDFRILKIPKSNSNFLL
jgi:hypothetical protein